MVEARVGDAVLVRGSPSSLIVEHDGYTIIIDPGHGGGKVKSLRKALRGFNGELLALVTHYHSDHFEVLARGKINVSAVAAPARDAPAVRDPVYRLGMTFGYPLEPGDPFLVFPAPGVGVDLEYEPGGKVWGLETIPLPGHTPGQAGIVTPGGVLYAADAIFGDRVLERYVLPYHRDPCQALETLESLDPYSFEAIVPGHGPVVRGDEAARLIDANIQAIRGSLDRLLDVLGEPSTLGDILVRLVGDLSRTGGPGLYMLVEQSLRGMLLCLQRRGLVEASLGPRGLLWVVARK